MSVAIEYARQQSHYDREGNPHLPVRKQTSGDREIAGDLEVRRQSPDAEHEGHHCNRSQQRCRSQRYPPVLARSAHNLQPWTEADPHDHWYHFNNYLG